MKSQTEFIEDKFLLETYRCGFTDELGGRIRIWKPNPLLLRAYNLGREAAIIGDDLSSVDIQTNEEILNRIHNKKITNGANNS